MNREHTDKLSNYFGMSSGLSDRVKANAETMKTDTMFVLGKRDLEAGSIAVRVSR